MAANSHLCFNAKKVSQFPHQTRHHTKLKTPGRGCMPDRGFRFQDSEKADQPEKNSSAAAQEANDQQNAPHCHEQMTSTSFSKTCFTLMLSLALVSKNSKPEEKKKDYSMTESMVLTLKSMPTVLTKAEVKESSAKRNRKDLGASLLALRSRISSLCMCLSLGHPPCNPSQVSKDINGTPVEVSGWIVVHPQPVELLDEGLHQVWLIGDNDVLHVALHCCQRPVEGAGDEQPTVYQGKLVVHVNRAHVASYTDPCGAESIQARGLAEDPYLGAGDGGVILISEDSDGDEGEKMCSTQAISEGKKRTSLRVLPVLRRRRSQTSSSTLRERPTTPRLTTFTVHIIDIYHTTQ
ncbi:hypothetical protein FQN60_012088 [Etheostoma spectabile]|uniref:Uncharacterized protein n=1 Tax=Etheostoma spectabile TaxID=54343 RepID=A0A5J5DP33_9PERO|nr:hypothetical protein FQN60_012088 [Etheostoma spectabile]